MLGDLGKSQLSSLLETVPGLASVLRSPVADAIVNMVRAAAGLRDFDIDDAKELVQYATRRGLIPSAEGATLLDEVKGIGKKGQAKPKAAKKKKTPAARVTKKTAKRVAKAVKKEKVARPKSKAVKKKATKKTAKKALPKKKSAPPKKPTRKAKKRHR